jgi:hypothetical protein
LFNIRRDEDRLRQAIVGLLKDWVSVLNFYSGLDHSDINSSDHSLKGI